MTTLSLLNGDCLEVMKTLPEKSVDLFICDLPFGCLTSPKASTCAGWRKEVEAGLPKTLSRDTGCAWDIKIDLVAFWKEVKRLAKNDSTPVIHFCTTKFGIDLINSNPKWFRYDLVWNKDRGTSFLTANKMPLRSHEMIYVFCKSGTYYQRKDEIGVFKSWNAHAHKSNTTTVVEGSGMNIANPNDGTTRCVKSVVTIKKPNTLGHPTEKPLELYKWIIERYCPPGGTVLDPTAGSFNSCFAAFELDRSAVGIEKDPEFYRKGITRLEAIQNTIEEV